MVTTPEPLVPMPTRWLVGFTDTDAGRHWLRSLLGWLRFPRHVLAFRDTPGGLLIVQHTLSRLSVTVQPGATEASFTRELIEAGGVVVPAFTPPDDGSHGWLPRPFWCVCVVRSLLSMPWRPQTPNGFLRALQATELANGRKGCTEAGDERRA